MKHKRLAAEADASQSSGAPDSASTRRLASLAPPAIRARDHYSQKVVARERKTMPRPELNQISTADLLVMVRRALEDIDSVSLDATLRRAIRIANLLGESRAALRLSFEIKATGGHPPANAEATRRLMTDPSTWGQPDSEVEDAFEEYMAERTMDDGRIFTHSVAEIEFWRQERLDPKTLTPDQYASDLAIQARSVATLARARHHAFTLLCAWERQLSFARHQEDVLDGVKLRVVSLLGRHAPEVLDQFGAAFRRLSEATDASETAEPLSQAVTSCRRILKAVVDAVQPPDPQMKVSEGGHRLTDEQYRNRLVEFLRRSTERGSLRTALVSSGESLFDRFAAVDTLASKGVHAKVAVEEAEFCALHTYLLAGEIVLLHDDLSGP